MVQMTAAEKREEIMRVVNFFIDDEAKDYYSNGRPDDHIFRDLIAMKIRYDR